MIDIERLELAATELADIQEDVPDDGHRDVIGWAVHYFRDAIDEIKRHSADPVSTTGEPS